MFSLTSYVAWNHGYKYEYRIRYDTGYNDTVIFNTVWISDDTIHVSIQQYDTNIDTAYDMYRIRVRNHIRSIG